MEQKLRRRHATTWLEHRHQHRCRFRGHASPPSENTTPPPRRQHTQSEVRVTQTNNNALQESLARNQALQNQQLAPYETVQRAIQHWENVGNQCRLAENDNTGSSLHPDISASTQRPPDPTERTSTNGHNAAGVLEGESNCPNHLGEKDANHRVGTHVHSTEKGTREIQVDSGFQVGQFPHATQTLQTGQLENRHAARDTRGCEMGLDPRPQIILPPRVAQFQSKEVDPLQTGGQSVESPGTTTHPTPVGMQGIAFRFGHCTTAGTKPCNTSHRHCGTKVGGWYGGGIKC